MKAFLQNLAKAMLLSTLAPMAAFAQPALTGSFAFTERRDATSLFASSHTFVIGATSVTPSGAGTTSTATHVPGGSGPDYALNFVPGTLFPDQYAVRTAYTGQTGQWDIAATDAGGTTVVRTHVLDDVRDLPLITGMTVSGAFLTPHITWDAVNPTLFPSFCGGPAGACALGFDFFNYQVEVRQVTGTPGNAAPLAFTSTLMPTTVAGTPGTLAPTMFDLPTGVLVEGNDYLLGVRLTHNELEAFLPNNRFFSPTENRSTAYLEYSATAPIPEPETYALMLAGLGLLVVARRRAARSSGALRA